jgi:hypothetical protein
MRHANAVHGGEGTISKALHDEFTRSGLSIRELTRRTRKDRNDESQGVRYQTVHYWATNPDADVKRDTLDAIGAALGAQVTFPERSR